MRAHLKCLQVTVTSSTLNSQQALSLSILADTAAAMSPKSSFSATMVGNNSQVLPAPTSPSSSSMSSNGCATINGAEVVPSDSHIPGLNQGMDSGHINTASLDTTTLLSNSAPLGTVNLQELDKMFQVDPKRAWEVAGFSEASRSSIENSEDIYC